MFKTGVKDVYKRQSKDKAVVMEVPVVLEGHAEGVKAGGKLSLQMRKLKVKAIYDQIPEKLTINVDHLGLGKTCLLYTSRCV